MPETDEQLRERAAHADLLEAQAEATRRGNGATVSVYVEGAAAADIYHLNGRELGAYLLGYWQRHLSALPDNFEWTKGAVEIRVRVPATALGGISALLLPAGCSIESLVNDGDQLTLRIT